MKLSRTSPIGKGVGVTDEQNAALENWKAATCFNDVQRAALAFRRDRDDEIATDATFNAIATKLTPAALIELQLSINLHHDVKIPRNFRRGYAVGGGRGVSFCL